MEEKKNRRPRVYSLPCRAAAAQLNRGLKGKYDKMKKKEKKENEEKRYTLS